MAEGEPPVELVVPEALCVLLHVLFAHPELEVVVASASEDVSVMRTSELEFPTHVELALGSEYVTAIVTGTLVGCGNDIKVVVVRLDTKTRAAVSDCDAVDVTVLFSDAALVRLDNIGLSGQTRDVRFKDAFEACQRELFPPHVVSSTTHWLDQLHRNPLGWQSPTSGPNDCSRICKSCRLLRSLNWQRPGRELVERTKGTRSDMSLQTERTSVR